MSSIRTQLWTVVCAAAPALVFAQSAEVPSGEEVVITTTRFEQRLHDSPIGVKLIAREEIERSGVTTLPDLLSLQPGFAVRNLTGGPDLQLDLGGFGITGDQNTLILVDGQRYSDIDISPARLSTIPLSRIERIEIVRGSGAVLYGAGATGGVINIITRSPRAGDRSAEVFAGGGSYATRDTRLGASVASQRIGANIDGTYYESDNYRVNNAIRQKSAAATLQTIGPGARLVLKAATDEQDLRLPGDRTSAELVSDRRGTRTPNDFANRRGNRVDLLGSAPLGSAEAALNLAYWDRTSISSTVIGSTPSSFLIDVDRYTASPRIKVPHRLLGMDNSLVAGADWEQWNYHNASTPPFPSSTELEQRTLAGYAQYSAQLTSSTRLTVGGREQNTVTELSPIEPQSREVRAYELALRQSIGDRISVWAKTGQSFRFATVDENSFRVSLLEPQISHDRQIGIEYQAQLGSFRASLYRSNLDNEIAFAPLDPNNFCCNVNLPPTRRQGVELAGEIQPTGWLKLSANYTYAKAQFREGVFSGVDVSGNDVPLVPRHKANVAVMVLPIPSVWIRADWQYVGTQRLDNDQFNLLSFKMPAYRVVNLSAGYEVERWRFELIVRNLLNEQYFTYAVVPLTTPGALPAVTSFNALPSPERSFFASAQYRFR